MLFKRKTRWDNTLILMAEASDFQQIKAHQDYIAKYPCPNCDKLKLRLVIDRRDRNGWESQIICDHCKATGIMNSGGVKFNLSGIPEEPKK